MYKKESCFAAGRFSDTILFRRSAILSERFLLYSNKKTHL